MESQTITELTQDVVETKVDNKNTKHKKTRYYETYISKVLKNVSKDGGITSNAKQQLNSAICVIAKHISNLATHLTFISKKKTMSTKEIGNAVKLFFVGAMADESIKLAEESIQKFSTNDDKHSSRQDKAGILFPPSTSEKFLRNFGFSNTMVTKTAPVYFASVLEYIVSYILVRGIALAKEDNRVRITIRDLELTIRTDSDLVVLFQKCNLTLLGGGVLPQIHESLLNKKPRKKRVKPNEPDNKKHRFRPGTVALREIRKLQKTSDCLTFAKFPFERFVRDIVNRHNNGMKISKDVFIVLQYYIEQFTIDFLRDANSAAIHGNRVKLMPVDMTFIANLRKYDTLDTKPYEIVETETKNVI